MWEKLLRSEESLVYRRKYKCPECGQYTLMLIDDEACECEEGCDDEGINVESVKEENDFSGYFTREEIENNFYTDFEEIERIFEACIIKRPPILISQKENAEIDKLLKRTDKIDQKLDDITVNYFNINNIKKVDLFTPYNYFVTLLEDMHHFLNLTCKDVYLFELSVSGQLPAYMYSGRFFANNAIDHLFQANERMYVAFGILYHFNFSEDFSRNKSYKIKDFIKKDSNYKKDYSVLVNQLNGNSFYSKLEEIRNSNEHDFSYMTKKMVDEKKEDVKDGDAEDIINYLPIIKNITNCLNKLYTILEKLVVEADDSRLYTMDSFPMYQRFFNTNKEINYKQFNTGYYYKLADYNDSLMENIRGYAGNLLITDVYFRLDEVLHCIRDIFNYANGSSEISGVNFNGYINIGYINYSALTRLYSCYDKISRYLSSQFKELEKIRYFNEFETVNSGLTVMRQVKRVMEQEAYIKLQELRNHIYHNIRMGAIFGKGGLSYYNSVMAQIILENEFLLFDLLQNLKPVKGGKIEKNAPCFCGSKKKYKYCHGKNI